MSNESESTNSKNIDVNSFPKMAAKHEKGISVEVPEERDQTTDPEPIRLLPIPTIPSINQISKQFSIENFNIEVTSVDITSHGCYAVVGCSNGMVLLFDMSRPSRTPEGGKLIGHIKAKGLHTNLILTAKITEDCRFCFAGVMKGSSEMLAIDLGKLPIPYGENSSPAISPRTKQYFELEVNVYSHADAKLRGFGAAVRVQSGRNESNRNTDTDNIYSAKSVYRLACGRGIKNVHVWQFTPGKGSDPSTPWVHSNEPEHLYTEGSTWSCIYDVATNGNTITSVGFRKHGMELISKSAGVNLRMWDISKYDTDPTAKPNYEDISNTQDVKCLLPEYALGGTYEFAVVKLDAPKEANRDAYDMPENYNQVDSSGLRKRRAMREIEEVISTQDGQHVLILCTDGGVMYFENPIANQSVRKEDEKEEGKDSENTEKESDIGRKHSKRKEPPASSTGLLELTHIQREIGIDQVWTIKRVGKDGDVVLIRAVKAESNSNYSDNSEVHLSLLSSASKGEIRSTAITADCELAGRWHREGYYCTASTPRPFSMEDEAAYEAAAFVDTTTTPTADVPMPVPATTNMVTVTKKSSKRKDKEVHTTVKDNSSRRRVDTNGSKTAKKGPNGSNTASMYITPAVGLGDSAGGDISPQENILRLVAVNSSKDKEKDKDATHAAAGNPSIVTTHKASVTIDHSSTGSQSPAKGSLSKLLFDTATKSGTGTAKRSAVKPAQPTSPVYGRSSSSLRSGSNNHNNSNSNSNNYNCSNSNNYSQSNINGAGSNRDAYLVNPNKRLKMLSVPPAPVVRRIVESCATYALNTTQSAMNKAFEQVDQRIFMWLSDVHKESARCHGNGVVSFQPGYDGTDRTSEILLGSSTAQQVGIIGIEQERLKSQIVNDIVWTVNEQVRPIVEHSVRRSCEAVKDALWIGLQLPSALTTGDAMQGGAIGTVVDAATTLGSASGSRSASMTSMSEPEPQVVQLQPLSARYTQTAEEMVQRQALDVRGAVFMDGIRSKAPQPYQHQGFSYGVSGCAPMVAPRVVFGHSLLTMTGQLEQSLNQLCQQFQLSKHHDMI